MFPKPSLSHPAASIEIGSINSISFSLRDSDSHRSTKWPQPRSVAGNGCSGSRGHTKCWLLAIRPSVSSGGAIVTDLRRRDHSRDLVGGISRLGRRVLWPCARGDLGGESSARDLALSFLTYDQQILPSPRQNLADPAVRGGQVRSQLQGHTGR